MDSAEKAIAALNGLRLQNKTIKVRANNGWLCREANPFRLKPLAGWMCRLRTGLLFQPGGGSNAILERYCHVRPNACKAQTIRGLVKQLSAVGRLACNRLIAARRSMNSSPFHRAGRRTVMVGPVYAQATNDSASPFVLVVCNNNWVHLTLFNLSKNVSCMITLRLKLTLTLCTTR